jgi:hypothetical protein
MASLTKRKVFPGSIECGGLFDYLINYQTLRIESMSNEEEGNSEGTAVDYRQEQVLNLTQGNAGKRKKYNC